jgi:hypothetical protein
MPVDTGLLLRDSNFMQATIDAMKTSVQSKITLFCSADKASTR